VKKAIFICSTGGHLTELLMLNKMFSKYDYTIITEKTKSTISLNKKYENKVKYLVYGTKSHILPYIFKFPYNCIKSFIYFIKLKPDFIITTGAHTAVPMCYIAKMFGKKVIYIETFANITTKTLSGRLVYPISDLFIVQWETMLKLYPKAKYYGGIF